MSFYMPIHTLSQPDQHRTYIAIAVAICSVINVCAYWVERMTHLNAVQAVSGLCVAVASLVTLVLRGTYFPRQIIATQLAVLWGARLSFYLMQRGMRRNGLFVFDRIVWSSVVAAPIVLCNTMQTHAYRSTFVESLSFFTMLVGLVLETLADEQKLEWFRTPATERGSVPVCTTGLWRFSRHPNLFGELLFQWGVYALVRPVDSSWIVICPLFCTLQVLLLEGGARSQELARAKRFGADEDYQIYRTMTSLIVPCPPALYQRLSLRMRWLCCCDFGIYCE